MNKFLLLLGVCIILCGICTTSADVGNWIIDGDKVYINDSKVYLSAEPHTLNETGFVYFTINSKQYSGNIDLYYGFNSGGLKPTRAYYHNGNEWVNIASHFDKTNYEYDGLDTWYYSNNLPIQAGKNYLIAVWMEYSNDISYGKYGFAIKPSFQTLNQAIIAGNFYYLDPWWNSDWDSLSKVTLDLSVPDNDFQVHLSSDDFSIPLKMWTNMNKDGNDTRILHSDNTTVFPIWIEHLTALDNYSIWVNVTDNTTGDTLLWYYGNSTVNTVSDADATFIQFHDDATTSYHDSNVISGNLIYEAKVKRTAATHNLLFGISDEAATGGDSFQIQTASALRYFYTKNDGTATSVSESPVFPLNTFVNLRINYKGSSAHAYVDGNEISTGSTTNLPDESMGLWVYVATGTYTQDWAFIRSYNETDSVISNIDLTVFTNTPPTIPTAEYPLNNSYVTIPGVVELNVSTFDVDGDDITVYFYGGTSLSNILFLGTNDTSDSTSYNWSVSLYDEYYWYAQAYDGYDYSVFSDTFQFTLIVPPNLTAPANTSTSYTTYPPLTSTVSFTWQDLAAPQYRIMIAEDANFNIMSVDTHIGTNNTVQTLLVNKEYWWKIYSYDGTTYSDSSGVYNFNLTGNSTVTGSAIEGVIYSDVGGVIGVLSGSEVTIWNETWTDTTITGSNGYYLFTGVADSNVYNVQAKKDLYLDSSIALVTATTDPITQNFYLLPDRTSEEWRHYVKFIVWGPAGYYEGVTVTVYKNSDVTSLYTAETGNDGAATFIMDRQQEYRVTAIDASQGINRTMTLYPKDEKYLFFIASTTRWTEHEDPQSDIIDIEISTEEINATHAYINVSYTDSMSETSSWSLYLNQSNSSNPYTQNTLQSTSGATSSWIHSFIVDEYKGQGYWVNIKGVHTTYGVIDEQYSVMFEDEIGFDGIPQKAFLYFAILVMMFTGGMFGASTAPQGSMIICVEGWVFLFFGWFSTIDNNGIIAVGLGAATVVAIIANINQYSKKEGHE